MRKVLDLKITDDNRDRGKTFRLTEMPALQTEKLALRAFLALARSGVEVPDNITQQGLAGLAVLGLKSLKGLRFEEAEPLLDEMMRCVEIVPNMANPTITRPPIGDDIEELSTLLKIRTEVFNLHVNFSSTGASKTSGTPGTTPVTEKSS